MKFLVRATATFVATALIALATPAVRAQDRTQDVTRATLKNGLQVVVIRDTLAPVVSTWLNYKAGSNEEPIEGLAHAQEHMLFRGSKTVTASQFADTTAITGGAFNADTQDAVTQYFFEMPSQYLDIALNLEASRAQGILDTQKLWDQERGAITQEVTRDNSSATYRLIDKVVHNMFAGTPYADMGLGTVASFKKIQAPDLKAYYDAWYHPNNAVFVIAGDVDPQATIAKVRALFERIPAKKLPARKVVNLKPLSGVTLKDESDDPYIIDLVAYRGPGFASPDWAASSILNDVLNSGRGPLFELQAQGKALGAFAGSITRSQSSLAYVGSAVPTSGDGTAAANDLKAVIAEYQKSGVPADLVEAAKLREVSAKEFAKNSIQGVATAWSQALAVENRTPDEDIALLGAVTTDDVNRVLRKYFNNATASVAIAVPKPGAQGGGSGRAGEDNTVIPTEHTGLPTFARSVLKNLRVPPQSATTTQYTLANGIKLIVQPEAISHTILVRGQIRTNSGIQEPVGKEGIAGLTAGLFAYGTTTYDRIAFQTELDKIAADVNAGPRFNADVLSKDFDRGVALLADNELHPAFPAPNFEIVKKQAAAAQQGTMTSPDFLAGRAQLKGLLPASDPAQRFATPASIGSVSLDDLKAFYASTYRPDLTTIVVIGDVSPDAAKATIEKYFGGWKAPEVAAPALDNPAVPANKPSEATIPATGRIQSSIDLSEVLELTRLDADYPSLRLANTVLSGGFYASLLYHDLRELHGYVYNVGSTLTASKNRSVFSVSYGADPKNIDRAAKLVRDDLTMLQTKPLPIDRLTRAKALVLGEVPLAQESFGGFANQLIGYASAGLPLDQDRIEAKKILDVTPAQMQSAMKKWIRPADFVRVVTGPAAK